MEGQAINIFFSRKEGEYGLMFVEVEDDSGKSICAGEWLTKGEYQVLRITKLPPCTD